jgi:hypothetical protein
VDVETVCEDQRGAFAQVRRDLVAVDARLSLVRGEHDGEIRLRRGFGCRHDVESVLGRARTAGRSFGEADDDGDAAVAQVQRLGAPLVAVADHGHAPRLNESQVGIFITIDAHRIRLGQVRAPRNRAGR